MFDANSSVMIIDMQCYYMKNKKPEDLEKKVPYQLELIEQARQQGVPIVFLEFIDLGHTIPEIPKYKRDIVVTKEYIDGFLDTDLEDKLKLYGIETIHVLGCNAKACVMATVLHGERLGYEMIVHQQGILSYHSSRGYMQEALETFRQHDIRII